MSYVYVTNCLCNAEGKRNEKNCIVLCAVLDYDYKKKRVVMLCVVALIVLIIS